MTITAPDVRAVTFRAARAGPRARASHPLEGQVLEPGPVRRATLARVEPLGSGRSRFTTHEEVSGILVPLLGKVMRASQQGFEMMAEALSRRVADQAGA